MFTGESHAVIRVRLVVQHLFIVKCHYVGIGQRCCGDESAVYLLELSSLKFCRLECELFEFFAIISA